MIRYVFLLTIFINSMILRYFLRIKCKYHKSDRTDFYIKDNVFSKIKYFTSIILSYTLKKVVN